MVGRKILLFIIFTLTNLNVSLSQIDTIKIEEINESYLVDSSVSIALDTKTIVQDSISVIYHETKVNSEETPPFSLEEKLIYDRLRKLDAHSPMEFSYNKYTQFYINRYLGRDVKLISRMLGVSSYYFPMIEQQLDKFQIPLELKYLAIVESALNPKARSKSGATGLWQFMYLTGKEYGLDVTSYIDERQDPLKSTIAACEYFVVLYKIFGDWNLVLAAYNGGPGYLKRLIAKKEINNYWDLRPYLRKETQGYVPKFIAMTYVMTYYKEYNIEVYNSNLNLEEIDTFSFKKQAPYNLISDMFCVSTETLNYLNPSFKKDLLPAGETICLPKEIIMDVVRNEDYFYEYLEKVDNKKILVDEIRLVYVVRKGDYLGKIAKQYGLTVSNIKDWNKMHSDNLSIGDKLILYIPDEN
tara:strand:- start:19259 stop:20494 length:1236 start_codon:yes stop_codon:yes gene_type:complete